MSIQIGAGEAITLLLAAIATVVWLVRLEGKIKEEARVAEIQRKADVEAVNVKLGNLSFAQADCKRDHDRRLQELEQLVGRRATIFREESE